MFLTDVFFVLFFAFALPSVVPWSNNLSVFFLFYFIFIIIIIVSLSAGDAVLPDIAMKINKNVLVCLQDQGWEPLF